MGACQYLIKPLSAHRLSRTVADMLHKKTAGWSIHKEYAASRA
jgi:response regulator of citrate/malate metabolism